MNPKILAEKEAQVQELVSKAQQAKAIVVLEYRGLTVAQMQQLRRSLKETNGAVGVYKNSIVRRAVEILGIEGLDEALIGPNALVFGDDPIQTPKAIHKFARQNELVNIKAGIVEGRVVDQKTLKDLSRLPGREGLISMVLGVLVAPIRQLACVLDQVRIQKESAN